MKTVTIHTASPYPVHIGAGLMGEAGSFAVSLGKVAKAAVISDDTVFSLYGQSVIDSLTRAGLKVTTFTFPAGEASKNGETYLKALDHLARERLTRTDLIVALGGGVAGDLAGFAAATYLRGIRFIQIPTTLLAAVDSSVGGKTAIDLPSGKNLAGAFHQPSLVLCDTQALSTLPESVFRDGCAEVIKYGILYDPELFDHLAQRGLDFDREYAIARCVELKGLVVAQDEFDTGARQKLNLGHTIGHGIEKCSGFAISHGRAVAMGTAIITRSARRLGFCSVDTEQKVLAVFDTFGLDATTDYSSDALSDVALSDKKRAGDTVNLIIPERIGSCQIVPTPVQMLHHIIEMGL